MASINKVILVGNLGADPELRTLPGGGSVCNVRLATTERWKDKSSGENREATEWHRVVFYRRLAEIAGQYLRKGSSVFVEGRMRTRKWTDKNGVERYITEVEAEELKMLGSSGGGDREIAKLPEKAKEPWEEGPLSDTPPFDEDDYPF